MPSVPADPYVMIRRLLLALLAFGLVGTAVELALMDHDEDVRQLVPFAVIAAALGGAAAVAWTARAGVVRAFRVLMVVMMAAGAVGVVLHYLGNREFQRDMDPQASEWQLFTKIIHAKAPPALAPGVLVQFGLLGLVATFQHPAVGRPRTHTQGVSS
jgi:fatty acid desaturase